MPGRPLNLVESLRAIVGDSHVLTDSNATDAYRTGFRYGSGNALAVVRPGTLVQLWRALKVCVAADKILIMQGANTGLTGGSTPAGDDYDREVVIVNAMRISRLFVIDEGRQVICLPGTTLSQLETALEPYHREPHSVIGSSCIGASVIGGICNSSGGALVRRGPAYTQMALFARAEEGRQLRLVNHLGVKLGNEPEEMLSRLDRGGFAASEIETDPNRCGSDSDYVRRVRDIDASTPARFNADPERLYEASGSAGKLAVFAVRLDTFPKDANTRTFYIGTRDPDDLTALRRHILKEFDNLPVAGEYIHSGMFDIAQRYGKDAFLTINHLGVKRLPGFLRLKRRLDSFISRLGLEKLGSTDRLLQRLGMLLPDHLPARMTAFRDRFEHHLILKMADDGIGEAARYLSSVFPSHTGDYFECTEAEARKAFLHRFVAAGAALRYRAIHNEETEYILALDIALRRNELQWFEVLPPDIRTQLHRVLYYGHFLCQVFHHDYIVRKGCDVHALKKRLLTILDERGAEYPAEHNVGHFYRAKPRHAEFFRSLDPCNSFNPGIGETSKFSGYGSTPRT